MPHLERFCREGLTFTNRLLNMERTQETWFYYVGTLGPHDPYCPPRKYLDLYDLEDIRLPENFGDRMLDRPGLYRRARDRFDQMNEREHREAIRRYLAFCSYEDALFGQVLDALDRRGERENTVVVFLSDHGDYGAEHGLWGKGLTKKELRMQFFSACRKAACLGNVRAGRKV